MISDDGPAQPGIEPRSPALEANTLTTMPPGLTDGDGIFEFNVMYFCTIVRLIRMDEDDMR